MPRRRTPLMRNGTTPSQARPSNRSSSSPSGRCRRRSATGTCQCANRSWCQRWDITHEPLGRGAGRCAVWPSSARTEGGGVSTSIAGRILIARLGTSSRGSASLQITIVNRLPSSTRSVQDRVALHVPRPPRSGRIRPCVTHLEGSMHQIRRLRRENLELRSPHTALKTAGLRSMGWELRRLPHQPDRRLVDGFEAHIVVQRFASLCRNQIEGFCSTLCMVLHSRQKDCPTGALTLLVWRGAHRPNSDGGAGASAADGAHWHVSSIRNIESQCRCVEQRWRGECAIKPRPIHAKRGRCEVTEGRHFPRFTNSFDDNSDMAASGRAPDLVLSGAVPASINPLAFATGPSRRLAALDSMAKADRRGAFNLETNFSKKARASGSSSHKRRLKSAAGPPVRPMNALPRSSSSAPST